MKSIKYVLFQLQVQNLEITTKMKLRKAEEVKEELGGKGWKRNWKGRI